MLVTLLGIVTLVNLVPSNAYDSMLVTIVPIVTLVSGLLLNAPFPMVVTPLPIEAFVRLKQKTNAPAPMLVTLPGIVTLPIKLNFFKAQPR
jgi:hypothetical protein